jgi:hypothetical protein
MNFPAHKHRTTRGRSRFTIFRHKDAKLVSDTGLMIYRWSDQMLAGSDKLSEAGISDGSVTKELFCHAGDSGFSLVHTWFKSNYHLPRHRHNVDCLYYVISGSVLLGNQVLRGGDGFFVPRDHAYTYRAGQDGAEVLEFRDATSFDIELDEKPAVFDRILQSVHENHDNWTSEIEPPCRR